MSILADFSWGSNVFIPSIRINTQRNQKPAFQTRNPAQTLSATISKEAAYINPQQKLAKLFEKQQQGPFETLKEAFKPEKIENFFLMGYLKRNGKDWKKTETGDKFISQFYKEPTEEEAEFGRYLASLGY